MFGKVGSVRLSQLFWLAIAALGFVSMLGVMHAPPAAAAGNECASTEGQFVQANIIVKVVNSNGTLVGYAKDYQFTVTAHLPAKNNPHSTQPKQGNYNDFYAIQKARLLGNANTVMDNKYLDGGASDPDKTAAAINRAWTTASEKGRPAAPMNTDSSGGGQYTVRFNADNSSMHNCNFSGDGGSKRPVFDFTNGTNGNQYLNCLGGPPRLWNHSDFDPGVSFSAHEQDFTADYDVNAITSVRPGRYIGLDGTSHTITGGTWTDTYGSLNGGNKATKTDIFLTFRLPAPANSTIKPGADLPAAGPYSGGQSVATSTWVDKTGPNTRSDWERRVWYESGSEATPTPGGPGDVDISTHTGTNQAYSAATTSVSPNPNVTINNAYTRICIRLALSNPRSNDDGGSTSISTPNPAVTCRPIQPGQQNGPPTASINVFCHPTNTAQHVVSYSFSDPDGVTRAKVGTTAGGSDVVSNTTTSGSVNRSNTGGAVTYHLTVDDRQPDGTYNGTRTASGSLNTATCNPPTTIQIEPRARLLDVDGNPATATVAAGDWVVGSTGVQISGCTSGTPSSGWDRRFWYENDLPSSPGYQVYDGDDENIDGPVSGSNTYSTCYTPVGGSPSAFVDGSKLRICVDLRLRNPGSNMTIGGTNPRVDCRDIQIQNELTPDVELSTHTIEPSTPITATAEVICTATTPASSAYRRIMFWEERAGDPNRFDPSTADVIINTPTVFDDYGTGTYCGTNPFQPKTVTPGPGVTRICTSLQLFYPITGGSLTKTFDSDCADVATKYFFTVTHGDVNAAAGFGGTCSGSSKISAFNAGGSNYRGSGSQIAAFSSGTIDEFASSSRLAPNFDVTSGNPKRLTFANTAGGTYGGGFAQCYGLPDYWSGPTLGTDNNIDATDPLLVRRPGNVVVTGSRTVGSVGVGNVSNLQWVIASGNIYIDRNVEDLHGVYIARGNIYTCAIGTTPVATGTPMATECTKQLRVKGALIAGGSVKLQRAHGSLSGAPGEIIEYNPFVWIQGINPANPLPTSTSGKLDFITTLPPIL